MTDFTRPVPYPVRQMSSGAVTRTLLLVALIAIIVGGLSYQLGVASTSFNRPGELVLLFVDIAPLLWFAAAPLILTFLRFQRLDARLAWTIAAAVIAGIGAAIIRFVVGLDSPAAVLLDPYTLAFPLWVLAAVLFIRTRARRFALGTDRGITLTGMGLGFAVAAVGMALGGLRLVIVGPIVVPGTPTLPVAEPPTVVFLTAATFAMVAGLFWLTDRTRNAAATRDQR